MSSARTWHLRRADTGEELALPERGTHVLGSAPERAQLVVEAPGVDPAHCALGRLKDGGWAVKDLGAATGTSVNGRAVTSRRLRAGDRLRVGPVELEVVDPDAPASAAHDEPVEAASRREAAPPRSAPAKRPLPRIGGFRLERRLGRGGMGEVYLAIQESLDRPVALKVLSPKLAADAEFVARFQREARAAAALQHPNVVVVYDVGEASGYHYLAMEFVAGGNLEERVAGHGPLPWRVALNALVDAARGLVYAEEHGIVHRDVKPANLMMDGSGTVKLADLGLAAHRDSEEVGGGGPVFGTPHFISPEQIRGEPIDHRSDLYSLGATAYRLLTGRTPFQGETQREILLAHLTEELEPLEEVPGPISSLVLRCLAKDPVDRPRSASELLQALQALLAANGNGQPAGADPALAPGAGKGGRKVALLLLPLLLAGVAGVWYWLAPREPEEREPVAAATPLPPEPLELAAADTEFLVAGEEDAGADEQVERELRILELEGQLALRDLPADLPPAERIERLEELAREYAGTSVAARAGEEITAAREALARREEAATARDARLQTTLRTVRLAAEWPPAAGALPDPSASLRAVLAAVPPGEEASGGGDAVEAGVRRQLVAEIARDSRAPLEAELERAEALAGRGAFDEVEVVLAGLLPRLDLPALPEAERTPDVEALEELASSVKLRATRLDEERVLFARRVRFADRARLEAAFTLDGGFPAEVVAWKADAEKERLASLEQSLVTEEARARVERLREDLVEARAALELLVRSFDDGAWRRRSISDPRSSRPQVRDVVDVDRRGLILGSDGGNEALAWSDCGFAPGFWNQLFLSRLDRDYTAEENGRIVALLRLAATLECAGRLEGAFAAALAGSAGTQDGEPAPPLAASFQPARSWVAESGVDPEAFRDEELVARRLDGVLESIRRGRWSEAEIRLETLLREKEDALLVLLASDGRAGGGGDPLFTGEEPPPAPPAGAPDEDAPPR